MDGHRAAVARIAAAARVFFDKKQPFRINHGSSTNSTRPRAAAAGTGTIDISALGRVLSVDAARKRALVEPNVAMDALVEHTLAHGLVPPVVMEFPGITCGGGFSGTGGESSSFRHGFFDDCVESVEMVLADGEVVTALRGGEHAELLAAAGGSAGTLGIATLLELRLVEARRFVRTTYRRTGSVREAVDAVREAVARRGDDACDFVDAILFSPGHGAVVTGVMTDDKPPDARPQTFSRAWDPWFYLHVADRTRGLVPAAASAAPAAGAPAAPRPPPAAGAPVAAGPPAALAAPAAPAPAAPAASTDSGSSTVTEYIPLAEYLFRYDRGGFWVGRSAFRYFGFVPFTAPTRWLLDDFLHTRMMYRALHASGHSRRMVVQDVAVPFANAEALVDYTAAEFDIWPLWLCPLRRRDATEMPTFHPAYKTSPSPDNNNDNNETQSTPPAAQPEGGVDATHMLNIGLWGPAASASPDAFVAKNRALEAKVRELGGRKWLYAHTYYAQDDFWREYGGHRAWYDALRARYRADGLPSVYDKVRVRDRAAGTTDRLKSVWPVGGIYGLWRSIRSRDYLLHRNAKWKYTPLQGVRPVASGKEPLLSLPPCLSHNL